MTAHEREVFLRVERRRAFHPRMNGIGRDGIELFWRGQYEVAGVIVDHSCPVVTEDVVILGAEKLVRGRRYDRFQFANDDALHVRILDERSCRYTGAESNDQYRPRLPVNERGQMSHHSLQAHVE